MRWAVVSNRSLHTQRIERVSLKLRKLEELGARVGRLAFCDVQYKILPLDIQRLQYMLLGTLPCLRSSDLAQGLATKGTVAKA